MKKYRVFLMCLFLLASPMLSAFKVSPPKGRLAIVADGNSPDPDDLPATAVSLALLSASGFNNRLVYYSHCCDLVRSNRIDWHAERERHLLMQLSCDGTARRWGGFENVSFLDAKDHVMSAVVDLCEAIDNSTAEDPLWIIEAGEPDIIAMALHRSRKEARKYVRVITHSLANDNSGDFYTWKQVLEFGIKEYRIPDQNKMLKVQLSQWDWAKNSQDSRIQWIWIMGKIAESDNVVKFQHKSFDCSDAGMLMYWLTGAGDKAIKQPTVKDIRQILDERLR